MLGLDYGSDSDEEFISSNSTTATQKPATTISTAGPSSIAAKLALPPPSKSSLPASKASGSSLSLPPPKTKKPAKKILVELPKLSKHASDDEGADDRPALKKPRLNGTEGGKASALLSMLPAPKKSTTELPKPERVLGGGGRGLVFTARQSSEVAPPVINGGEEEVEEDCMVYSNEDNGGDDGEPEKDTTTSMIPPSMLLKGKGKAAMKPPALAPSASEPAMDFFSLGSTSSSRTFSAPRIASPPLALSSTPSLSAAPKIEEFTPPSPKPDDPYPGYYQLPSGAWAMHDAGYYKSHYDRWQKDYEAQIRAYEKSHPSAQRGFEGAVGACNGAGLEEVNASDLADQARKEREEKKMLTEGAKREGERAMPRMTVNPSKMTGVARSRHQLGTMLMEAYMNREVLEEKIAQGKRNRKEAGNKYGF